MSDDPKNDRWCMNRRRFLAASGALVVLPTVGGCLGAGGGGDVLSSDYDINLSDYPGLATIGKTVLVDVGLSDPLAVTQTSSMQFMITTTKCTHQGCEVKPDGQGFTCPCHGSMFALDGTVERGPARAPLTQYDWTLNGDVLTIHGMG